jgi:outer membrane protein assembly factor BamB
MRPQKLIIFPDTPDISACDGVIYCGWALFRPFLLDRVQGRILHPFFLILLSLGEVVVKHAYLCAAILGAAALLLPGCGGSGGAKTPVVTLPASNVGAARFTITWPAPSRLIPAGAYSIRIALSAPGQTIAPQLVTRPTSGDASTALFSNLSPGNVTVTATAYPAADGSGTPQASGSEVVSIASNATLDAGLVLNSTVQTVNITPAQPTMVVGDALTVAASALDGNGALVLTGNSTWKWSNDTPSVVTISGAGTAVNVTALTTGTAVIHAQDTESGRSAQLTITVIANTAHIDISPSSPAVKVGATQQFTATVTGLGNTAVTWSVQEGATGGTITAGGLYTAPITPGVYHVRATSQTLATLTTATPVSVINGGYNGGLAPTPWPKYGADMLNTARGAGSGATGTTKWAATLGGQVSATCSLGKDGTVYVGAGDGKLYALDGATGAQKWSFATGGNIQSSPAISADGTVYFGSNDKNVYALDAATGKQKWMFPTGSAVASSPAIGNDGTIYIGSNDANIYALDGVTGAKKWAYKTGGKVVECPAIGPDGTIYVGSLDQNLYAIDGATGTKRWTFTTQVAPQGCLLGSNGSVYLASQDGYIYAVNAATGAQQWKYQIDPSGYPNEGAFLALTADGNVVVQDKLFATIFLLDGTSGVLIQALVSGFSSPSFACSLGSDGTIYPVSAGISSNNPSNQTLWAVTFSTNSNTLWVYQSQQAATSGSVVGADGTIYVGIGSSLVAVK